MLTRRVELQLFAALKFVDFFLIEIHFPFNLSLRFQGSLEKDPKNLLHSFINDLENKNKNLFQFLQLNDPSLIVKL